RGVGATARRITGERQLSDGAGLVRGIRGEIWRPQLGLPERVNGVAPAVAHRVGAAKLVPVIGTAPVEGDRARRERERVRRLAVVGEVLRAERRLVRVEGSQAKDRSGTGDRSEERRVGKEWRGPG